MSEIVEIGKDTVSLTVVDNNITLDVQTSTISLETASVGPQGIQGAQGIQGVQGTQGPQGLSGVIAQTGPPSNTTVVWVDTDDPTGVSSYNIDGGSPSTNYGGIVTNIDCGGPV